MFALKLTLVCAAFVITAYFKSSVSSEAAGLAANNAALRGDIAAGSSQNRSALGLAAGSNSNGPAFPDVPAGNLRKNDMFDSATYLPSKQLELSSVAAEGSAQVDSALESASASQADGLPPHRDVEQDPQTNSVPDSGAALHAKSSASDRDGARVDGKPELTSTALRATGSALRRDVGSSLILHANLPSRDVELSHSVAEGMAGIGGVFRSEPSSPAMGSRVDPSGATFVDTSTDGRQRQGTRRLYDYPTSKTIRCVCGTAVDLLCKEAFYSLMACNSKCITLCQRSKLEFRGCNGDHQVRWIKKIQLPWMDCKSTTSLVDGAAAPLPTR
mmetsp:Transcript_81177/g.262372  ORF Transcript_81177/g.262372 Transcript_81177/m.262372 type:complete len:330 (-) Transcript_81177:81-1070(-)